MSYECLRISKLAKLDTFESSEDRLLQNGKIWGQKFILHHNVYLYFTALLRYIFVIFQQITLKIVSFTSFNAFFAAVALMILVEKQPLFQIFFFYNHE